ncbi:LRP1B [Mytilus edulis]|uniref:LRP1B n=1 Tax=Mytilus edulis TaxID=6550 RepID=A0A8S3TF42_MYTED|nr:LRP1B [Mytilus edulis]
MQSSEVKQWKDIICTILGMDRKAEEFHNKYKIVLKIAKSKDSVWRKFLEFCSAFEMNEIRNTPRGSLKVTQLRDFSMLSSDNQIHILEETLQFRSKTIGKTKVRQIECKIKQLTAEREKLATTSSTLKSKLTEEQKKTEDFETLLNQERKKCSALEIKLQQLRRSENELKVVLDKQIDKNEKSSNLLQVEKTKYQTLEEMYNKLEFEVGTSVEAFWYPDKCWYTAKILMKTGKGYEVKYDVDKFVKDLPLKFQYPSKNRALQTVVQTGVRPAGLSIDSANNHLYWSDTDKQTVSRCNLDGTHVTVLTTLATPFCDTT